MKVGFTGTRTGMTPHQLDALVRVLAWLAPEEFHHGGAEGADTEAAEQASLLTTVRRPRLVTHRPKRMTADELLARNRVIVEASDVLIAAPECDQEHLRSGTWATVRYAREKGIPVVMLARGAARKPERQSSFNDAWSKGKVRGL